MGDHVDTKKYSPKRKKYVAEGQDNDSRYRRITFKHYMQELEEELLEQELEDLESDD